MDLRTFRKQLNEAAEVVVRLHAGLDGAQVKPAKAWREIANLFDEGLPQEPQPMGSILGEVESKIFANPTLYLSPRFFGYINGNGNQTAVLGELLSAALNQLCAKWQFWLLGVVRLTPCRPLV